MKHYSRIASVIMSELMGMTASLITVLGRTWQFLNQVTRQITWQSVHPRINLNGFTNVT